MMNVPATMLEMTPMIWIVWIPNIVVTLGDEEVGQNVCVTQSERQQQLCSCPYLATFLNNLFRFAILMKNVFWFSFAPGLNSCVVTEASNHSPTASATSKELATTPSNRSSSFTMSFLFALAQPLLAVKSEATDYVLDMKRCVSADLAVQPSP